MSLDVWLKVHDPVDVQRGSVIFVREDGSTREISREEWDSKFLGIEPVTVSSTADNREVYAANITHNLTEMAEAAGIYRFLWRPDELGVTEARQLVEPLTAGLALLKSDAERFEALNPPNGWGSYGGLVRFVEGYLAACEMWPYANVHVSR